MLKTTLSIFVGLAVTGVQAIPRLDCSGPGCNSDGTLPSTFPFSYPGIPNEHYHYNSHNHKEWQRYYHVDSKALPNVTQCEMPNSYAGNIPVNREGHPNNTLFFWGIEKEEGSLTREHENEHDHKPWIVWLNGGPGSSSMIGLFFEHGPCLIAPDYSLVRNPHALITVADTIYVDQPIGTGYSTGDAKGYIPDEDVMGEDFMGFLDNLVTVFPNLKKRRMYIMGESYAGRYIPYIVKHYFARESRDRPALLGGMSVADGLLADDGSLASGTIQAIETYPQLIDYDPEVYMYFREQQHLCGYDLNISYPQRGGHFRTLRPLFLNPDNAQASISRLTTFTSKARSHPHALFRQLHALKDVVPVPDDHAEKKAQFHFEISQQLDKQATSEVKRGLPGRGDGVIDPWYECDLFVEALDYVVNFTKPWSQQAEPKAGADPYYIPDALSPEEPQDAGIFLNDPRTVNAIHAPQSKCWRESFACQFTYPFGSNTNAPFVPGTNQWGDPSPPTTLFLSELFANLTKIGASNTLFEGNEDFIITAGSMIIAVQNTTFKGTQGFSIEPQTCWYGEDGKFAGVVHQERDVKYVLFDGAGHLIAMWKPVAYITAVKEFVLGHNRNGSIGHDGKLIGTRCELFNGYNLPGDRKPVFTGSGKVEGATFWPSATIDAWEKFIKTAMAPILTGPEHDEL